MPISTASTSVNGSVSALVLDEILLLLQETPFAPPPLRCQEPLGHFLLFFWRYVLAPDFLLQSFAAPDRGRIVCEVIPMSREMVETSVGLGTVDVVVEVQLDSVSGLHGYGQQYFLREVKEVDT